ncbi:hypothetical protein ACFUN8_21185 [Streptomyces sp. NPDC057307]|uniref:hypothetical protein n=1 Tax=Streptomyces sp. NPDC057307 TaxID=3346096 RepID=UPI003635EF2C
MDLADLGVYALLGGLPEPARAPAVAADLRKPGSARRCTATAERRPVRPRLRGDALLRLFLDEWREHGHVRENYPAADGENLTGLQKRSDGLMAWGGLLAYLAFGEPADARPDGRRFAHPGEPAGLCDLPFGEGPLDAHLIAPDPVRTGSNRA